MKNVLKANVSDPETEHVRCIMTAVTIVYLVKLALLVITVLTNPPTVALNMVAFNFTLGMAMVVLPI